ncbi:MAG: hypothetical protein ABI862_14015 [Ilumatobacteraceae bacterium]
MAFFPGRTDRMTGGDHWQCELGSIMNVGIAERGSNPFDGSLRKRLRIDTRDTHEYFVINNAGRIVTTISSATGVAATPLAAVPAPHPVSPKYATIVVAAQSAQFGLFVPRSESTSEALLYGLFAIAFAVAALFIHQRRASGGVIAVSGLVAVVVIIMAFGSSHLPMRLAKCVLPVAAIPVVVLTAPRRSLGNTR